MRRRWHLVWLSVLVTGYVGCSGSSGSSTAQAPSTSSSPTSSTPAGSPAASTPAPGGPAAPGGSGYGLPNPTSSAPMGATSGAPGAAAPGGAGYGLPNPMTSGPATGGPAPGGAGYGLPNPTSSAPATGAPMPGGAGYGLPGTTTAGPATGGPAPGATGYGLPPLGNSGTAAPTTTGAIPGGGGNGLIPGGAPMATGATVGGLPPTGPGTGATAGATATIPGGAIPGGAGYGLPGTGAAGAGIGGALGNPYGQQALPEPKTLMEFAQRAFKEGHDKEGFDYLTAHYLCNDEGIAGIKEAVKWSDELRRPTLGTRFGFGVAYTPGRDFTGDPQPIGRVVAVKKKEKNEGGSPGAPPTSSGPPAGMMGMPGGNSGAAPDGSDGLKALDWYTGDLGKRMFEELKTHIEAGDYGSALKGLDGPNSAAAPAAGGPGTAGMPLGMPAGMPGMGGQPANAGGKAGEPKGMVPGITWVGQMATKEAVEKKAREQGIDVLFLYEVTVTVGKNGVVRNTTKIRVTALERAKDLIVTPLLANHKLQEDREKQKDKDPVDAEVQKVLAVVEKGLKVGDLPEAITADKVAARIKKLASTPDNVLRTLLEAKLYIALDLLKEEELKEAIAALGGNDLGKLLTGANENERAEALKDLLPKKKKA